ncbi:histidine kinase [Rhodospirillum rubrum]|uniref:ATP-binding protein n=2 Tax=Rhodospirillum rubrum TaxID=1085 RepID=UPI001EC66BC7|nr:ATP-binding protein [Rhodospirillum rubrum]MBK1665587.1 histidine kinase [Rhodospirillum rubrum]MBK1677699.1 histidine kinase [Rhodospirillum rubrum]
MAGSAPLNRFFLLTLIGQVVALAVYAAITWMDVRNDAMIQLHYTALTFRSASQTTFAGFESSLDALADQLIDSDGLSDPTKGRAILTKSLGTLPAFTVLSVIAVDGQIRALSEDSHDPLPNLLTNPDTRETFLQALDSKAAVFGEIYYSPFLKRWVFPIRKAVRDENGTVIAVVAGGIDSNAAVNVWRALDAFADQRIWMLRADRGVQNIHPISAADMRRLEGTVLPALAGGFPPQEGPAPLIDWPILEDEIAVTLPFPALSGTIVASMKKSLLVKTWVHRMATGGLGFVFLCVVTAVVFRLAQRSQAVADARREAAEHTLFESGEKYRLLYENVETLVRDRTAELAALVDTLTRTQAELVRSEKLASLGAMVAAVAHEVNTPVGNALVAATTLKDHTRAFATLTASGRISRQAIAAYVATTEEACDLLVRSLEQAGRLVGTFKQVAVDQTNDQRRSFLLDQTIQEVITALKPSFRYRPITVSLDLASAVTMDSFPGSLAQVIGNLVTNAVVHGFDDHDSGEIRIITRSVEAQSVTIGVSDNGRGIAPAILPKIFDPFFTTRLGQGGSGLGLHIVYGIVTKILGGGLTVESVEGEGTRFTLTLPRVAPAEKPVEQPVRPKEALTP